LYRTIEQLLNVIGPLHPILYKPEIYFLLPFILPNLSNQNFTQAIQKVGALSFNQIGPMVILIIPQKAKF